MRPERQGGFTLLELIVVITIIGILGTFVVMNVAGRSGQARIAKATSDVKQIYNAAVAYEAQSGNWPESIETLLQPIETDGARSPPLLPPGTAVKDPWGDEYLYEIRENGPVITSYGKDGSPGGEGENQDFVYPAEQNY